MKKQKIGVIIPIRLASERLPNKALRQVCGRPIVWHLLDRACKSKYASKKDVVVCTTEDKSDDKLAETVLKYGAGVFRGSTDDIIKRFHDAMSEYGFDAVIQVDGDDILCDTFYMDITMERLLSDPSLDIVTCAGLPLGIASKSFTKKAMDRVFAHYKSGKNDTGFIYFFTKSGLCKQDVISPARPEHVLDEARLTLDYPEDLTVFTRIFEELYKEGQVFGLDEVVMFLRRNPGVMTINNVLNAQYWQRTKDKTRLEYEDPGGVVKSIKV